MKRILLILLVLSVLALAACSSEPEYPDYSTPERTLASLKHAAANEDAFLVYDAFASDFKEETGVTYELFAANLEANPAEFERMANIEIAQVFDEEQVIVILLEDGDRMFFVAESGLWKIRMIAPKAVPQ